MLAGTWNTFRLNLLRIDFLLYHKFYIFYLKILFKHFLINEALRDCELGSD